MPRLFILRHAAADPARAGEGDHERPLSPRGRAQAAEVAERLRKRDEPIDRVLCSTALRTRQTWEIVAGAFAHPPRADFEDALYDAGGDYIALLRARAGDAAGVLLVGHNPAAQVTALRLLDGRASSESAGLHQSFPPAALAVFDGDGPWRELAPGGMRLAEFFTPTGS